MSDFQSIAFEGLRDVETCVPIIQIPGERSNLTPVIPPPIEDKITTEWLIGDCAKLLRTVPENSIDLIFTSPPYADQRKDTYGGIAPDKYVEWFLPISKE